jgi:hypothetical protein
MTVFTIDQRFRENFKVDFWGGRPPGSASPKVLAATTFREAEQRFLLLFLEKEEYYCINWFRLPPEPQIPRSPWVGFAEGLIATTFREAE